jgi:O-methyltransferase
VVDIGIMLVKSPSRRSVMLSRAILTVKPRFTMVTNANLISLFNAAEDVNLRNIVGDIVECGSWNGGSAAMIGYGLAKTETINKRIIWLFDSFEGLPPPSDRDGKLEQRHYFKGLNKGSMYNVSRAFRSLLVPETNVKMVKGWFQDTLPLATVGPIALLHIDADWYDSVHLVLETFYDRVVPGGYIVLDDYGFWEGCRRAIHTFADERGIELTITRTGHAGAFFRKPDAASTS